MDTQTNSEENALLPWASGVLERRHGGLNRALANIGRHSNQQSMSEENALHPWTSTRKKAWGAKQSLEVLVHMSRANSLVPVLVTC